MNQKRKILFALFAAIAIIGSVIGAYAVTSWTHSFNWNVAATYDIKIYGSDGSTKGTEIATALTETFADGTYYFWVFPLVMF